MQASPIRPCRGTGSSANVSKATRHKVEKSAKIVRYVQIMPSQTTGRQAEPDRRAGDHFTGFARAFSGGSGKTLCERGGYQVLISMIDENVNQNIQDSINELKSQLVSKVIINVPLEVEAQKNRHRQRRYRLSFPGRQYSSVFNVSFNPADGTRASVKYLYELGHRDIALLAGVLCVGTVEAKKLDRNPEFTNPW